MAGPVMVALLFFHICRLIALIDRLTVYQLEKI
jgi:hypothetical protein